MKHYAFTGTKRGWTSEQSFKVWDVMLRLCREGFRYQHNGDCIGSDASAFKYWTNTTGKIEELDKVIGHPPTNPKYRAWLPFETMLPEGDYIKRDHDMVDASELLLATPRCMFEERRSGTWATIRYARKVGIKIIIVWPDGSVTEEPARGIAALL